jgi:PAS domain-containing protein
MASDIWITTDAAGFVLDCSDAAVELTGYSVRGARGRELPNMFVQDRPRLAELLTAAQGEVVDRVATFRPNDRKAIPVRFRLTRDEGPPGAPIVLRWTFEVRWPIGMRLPQGVDRRQLITIWRADPLRCIFVPGGNDKRRLIVCAANDEVVHEEPASDAAAAFARAAELQKLAATGALDPP